MTKEKVACQKALANYDKVKNNPTAGHSRVNSLFGSSNPDAPRLKAVEAVERYQSNLIAANSRKQRFHSVDMPSVMKQMQGLEENRLASSLTALRAYQYLTDSLNASVEACNEEMKILSLQLSPDKDIKTFIDRTYVTTSPFVPWLLIACSVCHDVVSRVQVPSQVIGINHSNMVSIVP